VKLIPDDWGLAAPKPGTTIKRGKGGPLLVCKEGKGRKLPWVGGLRGGKGCILTQVDTARDLKRRGEVCVWGNRKEKGKGYMEQADKTKEEIRESPSKKKEQQGRKMGMKKGLQNQRRHRQLRKNLKTWGKKIQVDSMSSHKGGKTHQW